MPVRSRLTVSTAEAAIDAAIAGVGLLRMMSYKIEEARRAGALEIVLEDFEPAPWAISLLYPGQGPLPLKLRAFLNFAAPPFAIQPGPLASDGNGLNPAKPIALRSLWPMTLYSTGGIR